MSYFYPPPPLDLVKAKDLLTGSRIFIACPLHHLEAIEPKKHEENIVSSLRILLRFGRLIGIGPIKGLFAWKVNSSSISFSKYSFAAAFSIVVMIASLVNVITGVASIPGTAHTNAAEYAWAPGIFFFFSTALFGCLHFYRRSDDLINIFRDWDTMDVGSADTKLFRDATIMLSFVMASALTDNVLSYIGDLLKLTAVDEDPNPKGKVLVKVRENAGGLEKYYIKANSDWAKLIPYHPAILAFVFLSNKFAWYAINYVDVSIAVFSRALAFKFKQLYRHGMKIVAKKRNDAMSWHELARDHAILCEMLTEIDKFLSPLIFISYGHNLYWTCIQLHRSLTPSPDRVTIQMVYEAWSFLHLMMRIFLVSINGARVNEWAHKISNVLKKCPRTCYDVDIRRLEGHVESGTIALTGLGAFRITKPFILQIVSVVFTFEIVLLQASQTPLTQTN